MKRPDDKSDLKLDLQNAVAFERLTAYVDGELSAAQALEVEAALASDAKARETVDLLRRDSLLVRAAFDESLTEPLPDGLLKTLDAAVVQKGWEEQPRTRKGAGRLPLGMRILGQMTGQISWRLALGGSLAAFVFGLFVSYQLLDARLEQRLAAFSAQQESDRALHNATLEAALEDYVSGESATWHNPESGSRGEITPIRTFKNPQGNWCREYASREMRGEEQEERKAIACRQDDGRWQTRILILRDS